MTDPTAHYTVLARRFRPQTFEDVVGQDRIGTAIRNAIQAKRVAHAYLFTGARGVGKTSTARIFAKALNCPNVQNAIPCNDCEVCHSISAGSDVDVLEIDGASNRGIDDIRSLRANVTIRSMRSPYKVYIIDEVHMLTKEAFNALLKTLEEPPPNVKFVFCTTEPNKVPDTILSRCQRFDFGTISPSSIAMRLGQIAEAEGVEVAEEALELLARRAAGSMRDSQSLFDQLLAFGSDRISADDVHQLLGTAGDDRLIELVDAIIGRRRDEVLQRLDASLNEGVQIGAFSDQLLHYLRDLLILAAEAHSVPLESVSESQRPQLSEQAAAWGIKTIASALEILAATKARMQRVNYDRALLELAIVRLSLLEDLDQIGALIAGIQPGSSAGSPATTRSPRTSVPSPTATAPSQGDLSTPQASASVPMPESSQSNGQSADPPTRLESTPVESSPVPQSTLGESTESVVNQVEFGSETLDQFWSELLTQLPERLTGHVKVCSPAISGPNGLELSFPHSYALSRQFCERTETRARIAELISQIAGKAIELKVTASEAAVDEVPKPTETSRQQAPRRRQKANVEKDPFVQQALDVFAGTVIDAREVHEPAGGPQ